MNDDTPKFLSLPDASTASGIPQNVILMAVQNGFALPEPGVPPYAFSSQEVAAWNDWPNIGRMIESRLKRNEFNEYLG